MEYKVINSRSPLTLSTEVTQALSDGWKLYGSIQISGGDTPVYVQTVIRYPKEEQITKVTKKTNDSSAT